MITFFFLLRFIIVRLLLSSVHREGSTGSAARDALLLCAKMSARCPQLAEFMLAGNTCPVLATGECCVKLCLIVMFVWLGFKYKWFNVFDVVSTHEIESYCDVYMVEF